MSDGYGAGSLDVSARLAGSRTIIERVRYDGIMRCSRAFRRGNAALIVLSQLGPGVVRGDAVTTRGRVAPGAHLIVTSQTATRLMGGSARASASARWCVGNAATLDMIGEPLVASGSAEYLAATTIDLGDGARIIISDVAAVPAGARVVLQTSIRRSGRELFYDAFDASLAAPHVVGTFVAAGLTAADAATLLADFDRIADERTPRYPELAIGIGALASGVFARVGGFDIWAIQQTLAALRGAVHACIDKRSGSEGITPEARLSST